jgi:dsRNA-specific ribonuclease
VYDVISVEGPVHEAEFTVSVQLGDMVATGTALSKQKARHAAAQNLIIQLIGIGWEIFPGLMPHLAVEYVKNLMPEGDSKEGATSGRATPTSSIGGDSVKGINGSIGSVSPISQLNELCMQRHWPQPSFELIDEAGLPNAKTFRMQVRVGSLAQSEVATSKKEAKKLVAEKMLDVLRGNLDESMIQELCSDEKITQNIIDGLRSLMSLRDSEAVELKPVMADKIADVFKNMTKGKKTPVGDSKLLLAKVADRSGFCVKYEDLGLNLDNQHQALAKLELSPIVVCYGQASDLEAAKTVAAKAAVEYLKNASAKYK